MRHILLSLLIVLVSLLTVQCDKNDGLNDHTGTNNSSWECVFSPHTGQYYNTTLPFQEGIIGTGEDKSILVIFLHGGSGKGNDNKTQMNAKAVTTISSYLSKNKISSVFLVPQCPSSKSWGGTMTQVLKGMIDQYATRDSIDNKRIYILGGSMGGTGTWNMLTAYPNMFAAAMPVAGSPTTADVTNVATTPIYTVMGSADSIMSLTDVESFVTDLREKHGVVMFDIETGWTHEQICENSYTDSRLDWIFSKTR